MSYHHNSSSSADDTVEEPTHCCRREVIDGSVSVSMFVLLAVVFVLALAHMAGFI